MISILWDGNSVADVMADALPAAPDGVLWVQASTVSVHDAGDMLAALADGCGARYVDAPVRATAAGEEGKLTVLAAGRSAARPAGAGVRRHRRPHRLGQRTARRRDPAQAGGQLLGGHLVAATAQSIALAQGLGLDPRAFLEMMHGSAVDAP